MGATRTTIDALLKYDYLPPIVDSLPSEVKLYDEFKKDNKSWTGLKVIRSVRAGRNLGRGSRPEGGQLPTAGNQTWLQQQIDAKYSYVRVQLTGPAIASAVDSSTSFTKALTSEVMYGAKDMYKDLNRQIQGDGSGTLALVKTAGTVTTLELEYAGASGGTSGEAGSRWITAGDLLNIGTAAQHAAGTPDNVTVSSVTDKDTIVIGSTTVAEHDIIVLAGAAGLTYTSYNNEIQGLEAAAAQSGTYQNLNLTNYPKLCMQTINNSGTNQTLTWELMQRAIDKAEEFGGGKIDLIVGHTSMRREILDMAKSDVRYIGGKNLDPGYTGDLTFNGIRILLTADMKYNRLYFLTRSTWTLYPLGTINWMDDDGSILSRVSGADAFEGLMRCYLNLSCDNPSANAVLSDITVTLDAT